MLRRVLRRGVAVKRIGLLGGMSWESSAEYYRLVNEATRDRLGGLHSADCLLRSVDFAEVEQLQRDGRLGRGRRAARRRGGGARGGRRRAARAVHEHDAQGRRRDHRRRSTSRSSTSPTRPPRPSAPGPRRPSGCSPPHTRWSRTSTSAGCATSTASTCSCPTRPDRRIVHDVIYDELCVGVVDDGSRDEYRRIMRGSPSAAPRASCSAAPRSTCSSRRTTRPCRSSTPPGCTPSAPSTSRSEARSSVGEPDGLLPGGPPPCAGRPSRAPAPAKYDNARSLLTAVVSSPRARRSLGTRSERQDPRPPDARIHGTEQA